MPVKACKLCGRDVPEQQPIVKTPFHCDCGQLQFPWHACNGMVFVFPDPPPVTYGALVMPEEARELTGFGTVMSAGKGYYAQRRGCRKKSWHTVDVKAGDRVVFDKDTPWTLDVKSHRGMFHPVRLMGDQDIQAIVTEEEPCLAGSGQRIS